VFDRDATASRNKIIEIVGRLDSAVDSAFEPLRHKEGANKLFYSASALADHSIIWNKRREKRKTELYRMKWSTPVKTKNKILGHHISVSTATTR
jgi:hypothetical protein